MNTRTSLLGLLLFAFLCANVVSAPAQTAKHADSARPQSADAAARKQFAALLVDYQNTPQDAALRDKIVALAKTLNPAPAIPQPAQDLFAKAAAQAKAAASADDFKAAAALFEQAAAQAPWYADAVLGAAAAYAKADDYDDAKRNLAVYLATVHSGVDTRDADQLGRDLERQKAEKFQKELQQFSANPTDAARRQIIKQVQAMKNQPDVPEEARGHYVMAVVLANTAEDNPTYEQRAVDEFKAALLAAPWWSDAYRRIATVQKDLGQYEDAIANLNLYLLTEPTDARNTQDEIYRLMALEERAADENAKKQTEDDRKKRLEEKRQSDRAAIESGKFSVEGKWYQIPSPNNYFVGGKANPECDYAITQEGGRWAVANGCSKSNWAIDSIQVQTRQISFRLSGHDPGYPYAEVFVTFTLSADGQTLDGQESIYSKINEPLGAHAVRWVRRD